MIARANDGQGADWSQTTPAELMEAHLARPANTARCYDADLATFAGFMGAARRVDAVTRLVEMGRGAAERKMDMYVQWLRDQYPALNTVRRKVQSIMGLLARAHKYNVIPWMFHIPMPAPPPIRDIRGPSRDALDRMLRACTVRRDAKGARDAALVELMAFSALRVNEALTLDVGHVDLPAREIDILAKGKWGRLRHPIPMRTAEAIVAWLDYRGDDEGPLFTTCNRSATGEERLSYWGAYSIVRSLGERAGTRCSPHRLRHFAATEHLRLTNGNIPWAMALTRHSDPRTLMIYNDERLTRAREAAEIVAAGIPHFRC